MSDIFVDIETFSSADIKTGGLYKYAQSPDFEVLLVGWSVDGGPVEVFDLTVEPLPSEVAGRLLNPRSRLHAFNAAFEWYCLSKYFGFTEEQSRRWLPQWHCTQLHGMYLGYPAGLAACGAAIGLPKDAQKLRTGSALIRTFCVPCEPTARNGQRTRVRPQHEPEKWQLFIEYNRQDVVAEMEIERRLAAFPVPEYVQRGWVTDQIINLRGVAVDCELVSGALDIDSRLRSALLDEAARITGLQNPNSLQQLSAWLSEEAGEEIKSLTKADVAALLGRELPSADASRVLEIRQQLGKTSTSKYKAINAAVCADGRVRGTLMYYGANRTGRWSGRLVQPQNLPRTHLPALDLARERTKRRDAQALSLIFGNVPDALSQLIRTALIAADGKRFIDADFSAIEARVVAWLAGEDWVLDVFRTHGKIYEATASALYGVPVELIVKGNPEYELRQLGKAATLALGYGGGNDALIRAGHMPPDTPAEQLTDIKNRWRSANQRIVCLWHSVENAALDTLRTGRQNAIPHLMFALVGTQERMWLQITLPSGRALYYPNPRLGTGRFDKPCLVFDAIKGNNLFPTTTWGGTLVENVVQAVARDLLAEAIERLEATGYHIVFHVHDEVVVEANEQQTLEDVCALMRIAPSWADGLPLNADGWVGGYYTKD